MTYVKSIRSDVQGDQNKQAGFTLIELVVGMSVIAITMAMFTSMMMPLMTRSVDPQFEIRAAEFAQSVMKEIVAMPYDENTPVGGNPPCVSGTSCTSSASLGADGGETRVTFDDVDDFNAYCAAPVAAVDITNATTGLDGYTLQVCVGYDGNYDGVFDTGNTAIDQRAKLIQLTVGAPASNAAAGMATVQFHAYRSNY